MMKMGYEGKGLGKHVNNIVEPIVPEPKGLSIWVLVMDNMMENAPKPRRHMKVVHKGLSFHVHYLKLVKIVFMSNAKVLQIGRASCRERVSSPV